MPLITVMTYPVQVDLEHNGNPIDTYEDDWGTYDIYQIETVYWEEKSGKRWEAVVTHPTTGQPISQTVTPYEIGSKNLPVPARINSYPLTVSCSLRRG